MLERECLARLRAPVASGARVGLAGFYGAQRLRRNGAMLGGRSSSVWKEVWKLARAVNGSCRGGSSVSLLAPGSLRLRRGFDEAYVDRTLDETLPEIRGVPLPE